MACKLDSYIKPQSPYLTFDFMFPDYERFKTNFENFEVDTTDPESEKMFNLVKNRFGDRTFKWQNGKQILARIEDIWDNNLYIRKRLNIIRSLTNDELLEGVKTTTDQNTDTTLEGDIVDKAFTNSGDKNEDGTQVDYLQGTNKNNSNTSGNIASTGNSKVTRQEQLKLYNEMLKLEDEKKRLFDDFRTLFLPFEIKESRRCGNGYNY